MLKYFCFHTFTFLVLLTFASKAQNSPYFFIENKGQWPEKVLYRADLPGGKMYLHNNSLTYLFYDLSDVHSGHTTPLNNSIASRNQNSSGNNIKMHSFGIQYIGANTSVKIISNKVRSDYSNFYYGYRSGVGARGYEELIYKNLYNGIDLKFYNASNELKYDFILRPYSNSKDIKLLFTGNEQIALLNGNLYITTSLSQIVEQKPYSYQIVKGDTLKVNCEFTLNKNAVGFSFPDGYNKKYPLIIDPILVFSTFSGAVSDNWGNTATPGENGKFYSGGISFGPDFPTSTGAYSTSFSGNIDVVIMKFDSVGSKREFATFIGGESVEIPYSLIVDSNNNLVILGTTSSTKFPVSNSAFQKAFKGGRRVLPFISDKVDFANGSDLFVSKLSIDGKALLGSTYCGGSDNDGIMDITSSLVKNYGDQFRGDILTDDLGYIYIASHSGSIDFPILNGFQAKKSGGDFDGVVAKFRPDLSALEWSTYLGGEKEDGAYSIKINKNKDVYVCGGTSSSSFSVSPLISGFNSSNNGVQDGFVSKIRNDGKILLGHTFLGTDSLDQAYFVELDNNENIFVLGQTKGLYPVSSNVYNTPKGGQFIHKLNSSLSQSLFSTVFGTTDTNPSPNISPTAFLVSDCGNIYVSGWGGVVNNYYKGLVGGSTLGLEVTQDALQNKTDGSDFYLMVLKKDAEKLLYATFFGGLGARGREHVDGGTSRFDKSGIIYHTVCGGCAYDSEINLKPSFPTTPKAWSRNVNSENCNMAAFKFDLTTISALFKLDTNQVCSRPFIVNLTNLSSGGVDYLWDFGDGTTTTDPNIRTHTYQNPGKYIISLTVSNTENCGNKLATHSEVFPVSDAHFAIGNGSKICQGESFKLTSSGGVLYDWSPSNGLDNPNSPNPLASTDSSTYYTVVIEDTNGCTYKDSILVEVVKDVVIDIQPSYSFSCTERPTYKFENKSEHITNFLWKFGDGTTSTEESPTHTFEKDSVYEVTFEAQNELCSEIKTFKIPVVTTFVPNIFTPNGDNKNDFLIIRSIEPLKLRIFNRWGKEVYFDEAYKNDWNADGLASGTYFYSIEDKKNNMCKGWIHILK